MNAGLSARLVRLEQDLDGGRLIVAKLEADASLEALLASEGVIPSESDLIVRITRPDGVGSDFARVVA